MIEHLVRISCAAFFASSTNGAVFAGDPNTLDELVRETVNSREIFNLKNNKKENKIVFFFAAFFRLFVCLYVCFVWK